MTNSSFIPIKMYNPIYEVIYDYEYLIPIFATASIGLVNFGPIGLSAGAFGAIDVAAKYYKIYDKPYLTSATLGWGTLSSFKTPYYLTDIIGATAGLLFPTGIFNAHLDKAAALIYGAIAGYSYMGISGAGIGFTAGVIDEVLSYKNVTHSYPLTFTLRKIAMSNLFLPQTMRIAQHVLPYDLDIVNKPGVRETIAIIISAKFINYNITKEKSPALQLTEDLYKIFETIVPKKQLDDLLEKQVITLIAGQVILSKLGLTFARYRQDVAQSFHLLEKTKESWLLFIEKLLVISAYLIPYIGGKIIDQWVNQYFQIKFEYIMSDQVNKELLTKGILTHLKQNRTINAVDSSKTVINSKVLIDNMNKDIDNIAVSSLLPDALSKTIKGTYAIGHLFSINAIDTILYSTLYNQLTSTLTYFLSLKVNSFNTKINDLSSKISHKDNHMRLNADSMDINDANDFNQIACYELLTEQRIIISDKTSWDMLLSTWSTTQSIISFLFNWIVIADQIYQGNLASDKRTETIEMTGEFSSMVSWNAYNSGPIITLRESMERILELKARMAEINNPLEHQPNYIYKAANQTSICFNNFKVGMKNESRLTIDDLCIKDKIIAVTSASGIGKSTLFKAIGKINHSGAWSEGDITYFTQDANIPYIAMTSQTAYIPPEDTLLELITFKKGATAAIYKEKVIELLKKVKIDIVRNGEVDLISRLDLKQDWAADLSGGQKQKIDLVRLLLPEKKAAIILFDELFTGVDPDSIIELQEILKNEFSDCLLLIIDHEAKGHNHNQFYDNELHLENGTAQLLGSPTLE